MRTYLIVKSPFHIKGQSRSLLLKNHRQKLNPWKFNGKIVIEVSRAIQSKSSYLGSLECLSSSYSGRLGKLLLGSTKLIQVKIIFWNQAFDLTSLRYFSRLVCVYACMASSPVSPHPGPHAGPGVLPSEIRHRIFLLTQDLYWREQDSLLRTVVIKNFLPIRYPQLNSWHIYDDIDQMVLL